MNGTEAVEILLVEDNPLDAELIVRGLRSHALANQIEVVEDGPEALDFLLTRGRFATRAGERHPRVVLLDIKLPKMNGLEVLERVKANPDTRDIPVVMVTSSREDPDIKTAYDLGANSYVVKPVEFQAFQNVMRDLGFYWLVVNQRPVTAAR